MSDRSNRGIYGFADDAAPHQYDPEDEGTNSGVADTTPIGLSTEEWCHAFCVALSAGPQQLVDVLVRTWFSNPECDLVADAFYAYVWDNAKTDEAAAEVWERIDKHFDHAMLHSNNAWQRRGGGRKNRPRANLWRRSQGRPHTARKKS